MLRNMPQGNQIIGNLKRFYKKYTLLSQLIIGTLIALIFFSTGCSGTSCSKGGPGFFTIIFQLYFLYFAGKFISDEFGNSKLLTIFGYGALSAFFLYLIFIVPTAGFIFTAALPIGIFSGIMALFVAMGTHMPNMELSLYGIIKMKFKWLVILFIVFDLVSGQFFSLAGAGIGFLSIYLKKPNKKSFFNNIFSNFTNKSNKYSRSNTYQAPRQNVNKRKNKISQKEIDTILDKISKSGYDSLNKDEKNKLFDLSKKN